MSIGSPPILVIGPPRSGTTLLATMLNAHSRIFVANETKVFMTLLPRGWAYGKRLSESVTASIITDLERNELVDYAPLPSASKVFQRLSEPTVTSLIRELFRFLAEREGKSRWGEKTAVAYRKLDVIRAAYPDARFIGLERDPEEIGVSYEKVVPKWGALGGLMHWLDFKRIIARQRGSFQILLVPYRKLVTDPETTLKQVCDYVGERYEPSMLDFYKTERARKLESSEIFGGTARPLYVLDLPHENLHLGLRGYIFQACVKRGNQPKPKRLRCPAWELIVRVFLFCRAGLWDLSRPGIYKRVLREMRAITSVAYRMLRFP